MMAILYRPSLMILYDLRKRERGEKGGQNERERDEGQRGRVRDGETEMERQRGRDKVGET